MKGKILTKGLSRLLAITIISVMVLQVVTGVSVYAASDWSTVGTAGFSAGEAMFTSIAIDRSGTPYVAYRDGGNSDKATVMKYNGTSWETVGIAGFSAGSADYTSIAIDSSGTPYVAYMDYGNAFKVTVMKYNGTSWQVVGTAGFSAGQALFTSIAIDRSGIPYVVFSDFVNSLKATVMKFNGTSWVEVGTSGFSAGNAYTSIAIDRNGTPYVACQDFANVNKATVMKYVGTSWVVVGTAGFSAGEADYTSIAIDSSGTPYVAYLDGSNHFKATVMKYNSTSWEAVGISGFSAGSALYTSIAIDNSGRPYVAYMDIGNKATVMKYEGTSWGAVGTAGFSAGTADFTSIAIDNSGTPYVVYVDGADKVTVMKYDVTPPVLSAGAVTRTSDTTGTVKFTSDEAGQYYYATVADGAAVPTIETTGAGAAFITGETTITNPIGLNEGAKDIYIKAKDAADNVSNVLKIDIAAYTAPSNDGNSDSTPPTPTTTPTPTSTPTPNQGTAVKPNSNYSIFWNPVTVKSVENHWSKDTVNDMASRLVIFNPESFDPNKAITRADFAEYIVRALGLYRAGSIYANKFKDVSATGERTLAILTANKYGIVTGYPDGTFRPDLQITREEAMAMCSRAMKITKLAGADQNRYQNYIDYKQVTSWAKSYVKDALSAHVFNGTTATTISPKSNLTYAEAVQAIRNLLVESKLINK